MCALFSIGSLFPVPWHPKFGDSWVRRTKVPWTHSPGRVSHTLHKVVCIPWRPVSSFQTLIDGSSNNRLKRDPTLRTRSDYQTERQRNDDIRDWGCVLFTSTHCGLHPLWTQLFPVDVYGLFIWIITSELWAQLSCGPALSSISHGVLFRILALSLARCVRTGTKPQLLTCEMETLKVWAVKNYSRQNNTWHRLCLQNC